MKISKIIFVFLVYFGCSSYADNNAVVEEVVTKKGLKFLFVENNDLPKVSLQISFKGAGYAYENPEKQGLSMFTSLVVQEGSGKNNANEFAKKLEDKGIKLNFHCRLEDFTVFLNTLSENLEDGVSLMSDAIMRPRLESEDLNRVVEKVKVQMNYLEKSPYFIAGHELDKLMFKKHPYARDGLGTLNSIINITKEDILGYIKSHFTRNNIVISVVGSVKKEEIAELLDKYLFKLPLQRSKSIKAIPMKNDFGNAENKYINMDIPQSVIYFAQRGISYNDPNYYNAIILINAIGGTSLNSMLMRQLRETLGMTYGVYFQAVVNKHGNIIFGSLNADSANASKAIIAIKEVLNKVKTDGIDPQLFNDTKISTINSHVFSMFRNENIVSQLDYIQLNDLDVNHISHFTDHINQVTLDEVNALAKSLLDPENLFIVEVGRKP